VAEIKENLAPFLILLDAAVVRIPKIYNPVHGQLCVRDVGTIIFCDIDPGLNFQNSMQVQP